VAAANPILNELNQCVFHSILFSVFAPSAPTNTHLGPGTCCADLTARQSAKSLALAKKWENSRNWPTTAGFTCAICQRFVRILWEAMLQTQ